MFNLITQPKSAKILDFSTNDTEEFIQNLDPKKVDSHDTINIWAILM